MSSLPSPSSSQAAHASLSQHQHQSQQSQERVQFECTLSNPKSIRTFAAAFSCLAKLGRDVILESTPNKTLTLRQTNAAKTSFLAFEFRGDFFEHFTLPSSTCCAKLRLKSCQAVFRTVKPMERLTLSLVQVGASKHVVMFRSNCVHEVTKTHQFYYEEAEGMDPVFDRCMTKHRIRVNPRFLSEVLANLPSSSSASSASANEIDFTCTAGVQVKIVSAGGGDAASAAASGASSRSINTEMIIPQEKFEEFDISEPQARLTFSIREWRELLRFCDSSASSSSSSSSSASYHQSSHKEMLDELFLLFNDTGMPLMLTSEPPSSSSHHSSFLLPSPFSFTLVLSTIPSSASSYAASQ